MSTQQHTPEHTPRRYTSAALTGGVVVAATCFAAALLAEIAGTEPGAGEMTDLRAVLDGLLTLTPWAWAALGVYAVVVTPVVGLVVTAWEYSSVGDRRTMGLAIAVIAVLVTSAFVAILR